MLISFTTSGWFMCNICMLPSENINVEPVKIRITKVVLKKKKKLQPRENLKLKNLSTNKIDVLTIFFAP